MNRSLGAAALLAVLSAACVENIRPGTVSPSRNPEPQPEAPGFELTTSIPVASMRSALDTHPPRGLHGDPYGSRGEDSPDPRACEGKAGCTARFQAGGQRPVLRGLADFHAHQFGHLGFGGTVLSHSPDSVAPCLPPLPYDEKTLRMRDLVRHGLFAEAKEQFEATGQCAPTTTNLASQRMDTGNLRRAWQYGLRLIVMHAVNNEFLCKVAELAPGGVCPDDRTAIELQIRAARDLEARIDAASGGTGLGWYRIVSTPEQARDVISQGKLAVVLGVEASNAFGCTFVSRHSVPGVPPLVSVGNTIPFERSWELECDWPARGLESMRTQLALALFEHYWGLGVRHFFPIHNMDGTAGGTALSIPLLHASNNPSQLAPGGLFNRVPAINQVIRAMRPPVQAWNCGSMFRFDLLLTGRCNASGLTATGKQLIRLMASHGAVIDIDHISWKGKRELLADGGLLGGAYPFVSSHGGIHEISHWNKNNEGQLAVQDFEAMVRAGGAFAPILPPVTDTADLDTYPRGASVAPHRCGGTSESFVQAYRYVVDRLKGGRLLNGQPAFVGVGFGSDFSSPVPVAAAPRFTEGLIGGTRPAENIVTGGPLQGPGGHCYLAPRLLMTRNPRAISEPHVTYPFTSPMDAGVTLHRSTAPWSRRIVPYDISFDGVAHVGMIPDFVEELRALGLTDSDLEPLWHGAEAYLRAWESSAAWRGHFTAEDEKGIARRCARLRANLIRGGSVPTSTARLPLSLTRGWQITLDELRRSGCHGF